MRDAAALLRAPTGTATASGRHWCGFPWPGRHGHFLPERNAAVSSSCVHGLDLSPCRTWRPANPTLHRSLVTSPEPRPQPSAYSDGIVQALVIHARFIVTKMGFICTWMLAPFHCRLSLLFQVLDEPSGHAARLDRVLEHVLLDPRCHHGELRGSHLPHDASRPGSVLEQRRSL